jgi:hypothetical protein
VAGGWGGMTSGRHGGPRAQFFLLRGVNKKSRSSKRDHFVKMSWMPVLAQIGCFPHPSVGEKTNGFVFSKIAFFKNKNSSLSLELFFLKIRNFLCKAFFQKSAFLKNV